jgi:hypothetical protein
MNEMFGKLSAYWADSKRVQPETGWGVAVHISRRIIVAASWWVGLAVLLSIYLGYQLILIAVGARK